MTIRRLLMMLSAAVLLSACATPASRIKDHPDIYARATPQQQALISQGRIALGFSPDFVRLALGAPDRITQHIDEKGTQTVWHYEDQSGDTAVAGYAFSPYFFDPFFGPAFTPVIVERSPRDRDRLRVVFKDDKVSVIEQVVKN